MIDKDFPPPAPPIHFLAAFSSVDKTLNMGFAAGIILLLAVAIAPASLASPTHTASPVVDLGYARYQGAYNTTYDINVFKGYLPMLCYASDTPVLTSCLEFDMQHPLWETYDGKLPRSHD